MENKVQKLKELLEHPDLQSLSCVLLAKSALNTYNSPNYAISLLMVDMDKIRTHHRPLYDFISETEKEKWAEFQKK